MNKVFFVKMYKHKDNPLEPKTTGEYVLSKSYEHSSLRDAQIAADSLYMAFGHIYPKISVVLPDGSVYADYEF